MKGGKKEEIGRRGRGRGGSEECAAVAAVPELMALDTRTRRGACDISPCGDLLMLDHWLNPLLGRGGGGEGQKVGGEGGAGRILWNLAVAEKKGGGMPDDSYGNWQWHGVWEVGATYLRVWY